MEPKTELQKNAVAEARRKELETFQRALDIQWLNNRMADGGMGRCLALIKKEAEMEKDFQERTDHAAIVNARAQKETDLGIEIAKATREESCALLRRHYLRERDPHLRELMRKLQAGYVRRDLQQQILHNEYKRRQDKVEKANANRVMCDALYNDHEAREREEKIKEEKCRQYCTEIQQQLVNKQRQRHCEYEDTLIEKKMMDDIMRTIADEDQRELQQKKELTEKMRNEMVTFKKARDAWKEKQKQMVVIEERRIEEQKKAASDRSSSIVQERERKQRLKEELNQKIIAKVLADKAALDERDNIIKQLQEQEHLEKNVQEQIAEKQTEERRKRETGAALEQQMRVRREAEQRRRELERTFRKDAEEKMAAEERKEIDKEKKKREKAKLYALELQKQIKGNEEKRRADKEMEDKRVERVWTTYKDWDVEVAQERRKIIEEHVPRVLGYLQAGVLRKEDLPAVRDGLRGRADLPLDALAGADDVPERFPKCNKQCRILREY